MKYIIFEDPIGEELPIIFPSHVNHSDISTAMVNGYKQACLKPVSAGTVSIDDKGNPYCHGNSFTLNLKSEDRDTRLIKIAFRMG